jgi:hypothetical protein
MHMRVFLMKICAVGQRKYRQYMAMPQGRMCLWAKHVIEFFPCEIPIGLNLGGSIGNLR